ncbi:hypothetical protein DICVIV_08904 [Dictyocaulus viviparus]|uniref:Uncharacterized protein n=1 Tax=Dictyocaulus viviparus TaxID=29172 RepID=A0A0D8XMM3_DICVI|nr:hypothetical protein DICVIV_08904 [Dictyocaulus viviparus]
MIDYSLYLCILSAIIYINDIQILSECIIYNDDLIHYRLQLFKEVLEVKVYSATFEQFLELYVRNCSRSINDTY